MLVSIFRFIYSFYRRCLCVRTQCHPSPPENFVFDRASFVECGSWHHITLTHVKQQVSLFVGKHMCIYCCCKNEVIIIFVADGKFSQSCSSLNYPKYTKVLGCIGKLITESVQY